MPRIKKRREFIKNLAALGGVLGLAPLAISRMIGSEIVSPSLTESSIYSKENAVATMVSTWNYSK